MEYLVFHVYFTFMEAPRKFGGSRDYPIFDWSNRISQPPSEIHRTNHNRSNTSSDYRFSRQSMC